MNRKCLRSWLALVVASGFVLQPQAQQRPKDEPPKTPAHQEFEARRGLPGFEWIEPLYPDCPEERFRMQNDECGGVKKHPGDPEAVLGDYWCRSVWAYSAQFAEHFRPADKSAVRADLPRHVQAIELRVAWDQEHYRYQCEVNVFVEGTLMDFVKLPAGRRGARFSAAGMLPPGAQRPSPVVPAWGGFDDEAFATYNETSFSMVSYNDAKKKPGTFTSGRLLRYHRDVLGSMGYLGFMDKCRDNLLSYGQHEIWLPAARTADAPVGTHRYGKDDYLVLPLPAELVKRAEPYWRRAFGLNVCRSDGQHAARWSTGGRERQFRACEALRREPIDSSRTLIELQKEQWELDQRQKAR